METLHSVATISRVAVPSTLQRSPWFTFQHRSQRCHNRKHPDCFKCKLRRTVLHIFLRYHNFCVIRRHKPYFTNARVDTEANSYINASTTIPKTYTTNTFTGANTFNQTISGFITATPQPSPPTPISPVSLLRSATPLHMLQPPRRTVLATTPEPQARHHSSPPAHSSLGMAPVSRCETLRRH